MRVLSALPLRAMLTLPFMGLVVLLVLVTGGLSYRAGGQALDTWSEQLLVEKVRRIEQAVLAHIAGSAAVLEAAFPTGVPGPAQIGDDLAALRTRFWLATSVHRGLNNYAYYGDRDGHFFGLWRFNEADAELRLRLDGDGPRSISHFSGIDGTPGAAEIEARIFEPRERPWFRTGESAAPQAWTAVYIDFKLRELVATRARRVPDAQGNFRGVVATDLSLQRLNDFVTQLAISANGVALIAEPGGDLIAVSRGPNLIDDGQGRPQRLAAVNSPEPLVAAAFRALGSQPTVPIAPGATLTSHFKLPDGETVQVGYSRLRDDAGLDWHVMVAVPRSDFIWKVRDNFRVSLVLGALAAVAVILLGLWVLRTIANELRGLAAAARRIGDGDLSSPPSTQRADELGDLARSFAEMQKRLLTDQLTGLSNRTAALRHIQERILHQRRAGDSKPFALLFIDANGLKRVNDQLGHDVGDRMLREMGQRIRTMVRAGDMVARHAGDEFLVLIDGVATHDEGSALREALEARLREPITWLPPDQAELTGHGAAIGLAVFPDDGQDVETLIRVADQDMYRRKAGGRPALVATPAG